MAQEENVEELRVQVAGLESELGHLRHQLAEAELDNWRARIDDVELQVHLASLDAQDHIQPLIDGVRNLWLDAQSTLATTTGDAGDAFDDVRKGLDRTMRDLRRALLDALPARTG